MKSLFIIQKTFNLLKVLCTIGMVVCFIGAGSALFGYLGFNSISNTEFEEYLSTLGSYSDLFSTFTIAQLQSLLLISLISTLTSGILLWFGRRYLKSELMEGTPFTITSATNIRIVGIMTLIIPLISDFIITYIAEKAEILDFINSSDSTFVIGVFLIITSFIFLYGAELTNNSENKNNSETL